MSVLVELFGVQRDIARTDKISIPVHEAAIVRDVIKYVRKNYPALSLDEHSVLATVNHELASLDKSLKANDIVCFLPPIGGG
jgi:molybdopterin converting factor small subunit